MRTLTTLLAASLILSSGSALAGSNNTAKTPAGSQDKHSSSSMAAPATAASDAKYCLDQNPDEATGSRIYTHECRTKSEWAKRGVDIDELQKQQ